MNFKFYFDVVARCRIYDRDHIQGETITSYTEDLVLKITEEIAYNILFKFTPSGFMIDSYKALYKYDIDHNIKSLTLFDNDNKVYIITNLSQFLSDVHKGYIRYQMMKLLNNVDEFDFEAAIDIADDSVEDEFES